MSLYEDLGVEKDATTDEIKKTYRKKAQKLHPDKPGGDGEKFAVVARAYAVLGDDERRRRYDETGKEDEQTPIDQKMTMMGNIIIQAIEQLDVNTTDIIEALRMALEQMAGEVKTVTTMCEKRIKKRESALKRLKKTTSGKGFLEGFITGDINRIKMEIKNKEEEAIMVAACQEMIVGYEYSVDKASDHAFNQGYANPFNDVFNEVINDYYLNNQRRKW